MSLDLDTPKQVGWRDRVRESKYGTVIVLVVVGVLVLGAAMLVKRPNTDEQGVTAITINDSGAPAPQVGQPAPNFTAKTVDGQPMSLAGYLGKPVWLTFGASWCADCQVEANDIQAAYEKYRAQGLVVQGIFINENSAAVSDYAQRIGLTFPKVADPNTDIASLYRVLGIPAHFFIGRDGTIKVIKTGSLSPQQMDEAIAETMR